MRIKGVRLIAVNDNYDSLRGEDDFLPFRNIMNEWYAKNTSKKIRSTFQSKWKAGKHTAYPVWIRKIDRLCRQHPEIFKQVDEVKGISKTYECPKKYVSIRKPRISKKKE